MLLIELTKGPRVARARLSVTRFDSSCGVRAQEIPFSIGIFLFGASPSCFSVSTKPGHVHIGARNLLRQRGLVLAQTQLIRALQLLQRYIEQLEQEIKMIVEQAREGKILASTGIGPIRVATIIAPIGNIENVPNAGSLKSYFGWAPAVAQSGKTLDWTGQTRGGSRTIKQMMFLVVAHVIKQDIQWALLYHRLIEKRCPYDERRRVRVGRLRVFGRVAGQMIETMYALLKLDAEILGKVPNEQELPAPTLYDPDLHRRHREGHYQPLKPTPRKAAITLLLPILSA